MSDNGTQKITAFQDSVLKEANERITHILAGASEEGKRVIEKAKDDFINESYRRVSSETRTIKDTCRRRVSKQSFDSNRAVLNERNLLVDDFFVSIEKKLKNFVKNARYLEYIKDNLQRANTERPFYEGVTVLCSADSEKALLLKDFPVLKIEPPNKIKSKIKIGGVILYYPKEKLYVDLTLDKKLKNERERFVNNSELMLV